MRLAVSRLARFSFSVFGRTLTSFVSRRTLVGRGGFRANPSAKNFYDASKIAMAKQWKIVKEDRNKRRKIESGAVTTVEGSAEDVLQIEVAELLAKTKTALLGKAKISENESTDVPNDDRESLRPPASSTFVPRKGTYDRSENSFKELELQIVELSSTGDGLAFSEDGSHVYVVPFVAQGEKVLAKAYPQRTKGDYTHMDLVEVLEPSEIRDQSLIKCKYFGTCGGCQFQMLPYEAQLAHKKTIVERAFRHFSGLRPDQIPPISDTIGSPLQYGYRTKLTPHFSGYPNKKDRPFTEAPPIGFIQKGRPRTMDIESCAIGTDILQPTLTIERAKVAKNFGNYKRGATILLRESTERTANITIDAPKNEGNINDEPPVDILDASTTQELTTTTSGEPLLLVRTPTHTDAKTCVTDNNALSTEYINDFKFTSKAGSFFQNNNSILPRFTAYVRTHAFPPILNPSDPPIKYLLDAYCGSGLFAVTLSSLFTSALGIDIDPKGVQAARVNALQNNIPNAGFIEADAAALFADVPYPNAQTLVVIDPPRKGASEDFLKQLMRFGPKRVIYVSCNVHTQARDIGILVNGLAGVKGWKYEIETLRGFDFFPQTGHVEGVAFLNRVENTD